MAAALVLTPVAATAGPSDPAQWPDLEALDPQLDGTRHTLRYAGADRYQTNAALGLALRGSGSYPFDTSDRSGGSGPVLAGARHWWGAGVCPRAIIVVAGDTVADALAASSLSDPLDRSDQPRLRRVAAADPDFDRIDAFDRVDTAHAPVVVTTSARAGARTLAETARFTAGDLAAGGCSTAREAIIVGGTAAVPRGVETELLRLGYTEVFRVAGDDRYATAAEVAFALGTGTPPPDGTPCADPTAADGTVTQGWYGNAVVEFRPDPAQCSLLGRSVVLADGVAGVDALAAGWWTSRWQVPILLTGPGGSLPPATQGALESLPIDTIIKLGGDRVIPESTLDLARTLSGARRRGTIAGADRYATSVEMAKAFGGWFPGTEAAFADDAVCVTASSGDRGWPDALAAGPWCAQLAASSSPAPRRALTPVTGPFAGSFAGGSAGTHTAVPLLLVPASRDLPAPVAQLLQGTFGATPRCTGLSAPAGCANPGFAAVIGGVVGEPAVAQLDDLLGGIAGSDAVALSGAFATRLDLRPVYLAGETGTKTCVPGDSIAGARWISLSADPARRQFLAERDLVREGWYGSSGNDPRCVPLPAGQDEVTVTAVGTGGRVAGARTYDLRPEREVTLSGPIEQRGGETENGNAVRWSIGGAIEQPVTVRQGTASLEVRGATLNLELRLDPEGTTGSFTGSLAIEVPLGSLTATVRGDLRRTGTTWELAGGARFAELVEPLRGGFRATVTSGPGAVTASWRADGVPSS